MHLDEALTQITEIQARIADAETFRGYRSLTVAFSGGIGVAAAVVQAIYIPRPQLQLSEYLTLWLAAAAINLAIVGAELVWCCRRTGSPRMTRLTRLAVEQFLPCIVAGAVLTTVLALTAPECCWTLPGLWALLFSLGVFASHRLLPRAVFWVGVFYLLAGGLCLAVGQGDFALSPWLMAGTFGAGQGLTAVILYWTLERCHETP